jgi:hypothetical protein
MTRAPSTNSQEPSDRAVPGAPEDGQLTDHPDREQRDPGAYVGRQPERQSATIPGGISPEDERVAAHSTQSGPTAGDPVPDGHREGPPADDDQVREAGQSR